MKFSRLLMLFLTLTACQKDNKTIVFSEVNILNEDTAVIEINIPKAEAEEEIASKINRKLNDFVSDALHIETEKQKKETIEESIQAFKDAYSSFNTLISEELENELPVWEALIDGEVIYNKENIICIAMNASINTGAANTSMVFRFLNFNPKTGDLLTNKDLLTNEVEFTALVEKYYTEKTNTSYINKDTFSLPNALGFTADGVIILYDNFNLGAFEKEIIEFTIPYSEANDYLKI